ncbi:unnamed protein product [Rhizoctonia solani]|uniref:NAD(P)-binding protein n=1 Tax=Rhizoctonia solani TaxID=456999 RepID=A0A8H3B4I0_9AGAM|nr:unnamed protein product [Rhizoctonia solani]
MASRCSKRAQTALAYLEQSTGKIPETLTLDLADLRSVREAVSELTRRETVIHCLINNGGVFAPPLEAKTAQGYDLQFGTHLTQAYLGAPVRVVNVSSIKHLFAPKGGVDYDSLVPYFPHADRVRESMGGDKLYCQSKWGLIAFSNELARRYGSQGIISISLHPGNIRSEIMRHNALGAVTALLADVMLWDCSYGALTQLYAATDPGALELNGKASTPFFFFRNWAKVVLTQKMQKRVFNYGNGWMRILVNSDLRLW